MKSAIYLLCIVPCLLATAVRGAPKKLEPKTSPELVAKTVAWQLHWDQKAGIQNKAIRLLTFKMNGQAEVLICELDWIITFVYQGSQSFPHFVQRLESPPGQIARRALEPFGKVAKQPISIPPYTNSFFKISILKADKREKLMDAFKIQACSSEMLDFYKDADGKPIKSLRFWIAPVDADFPVMLYFVEGVPYIGRVYFDTHSLKPLYVDFDYIKDPGSAPHAQGLKLMTAIREEGDQFEFKSGRLAPAR